jgi:hypothetical protein
MSVSLAQLSVLADAAGPRVVGRSAGVSFETEEAVLKVISRYGRPAAGFTNDSVFVLLLGNGDTRLIASVRPGDPCVFQIVLADKGILDLDSFAVAATLPISATRGELPPLVFDIPRGRERPVAAVRDILQKGDAPLLLGAAQALLDGCKIAVSSADVPATFVRDLWQLLPDLSRAELSFATFSPSADLNFDVAVLPAVPAKGIKGFLSADQVRDYPEGRYELALQRAAENGDQAALNRLFARRTSSQVLRMVIGMILFAFIVVILLKFI